MQRRDLLQGVAALPLLAALGAAPLAESRQRRLAAAPRLRPSDAAWPARRSLAVAQRRGRRQSARSASALQPLREARPGGAACRDVLSHIRNPFYIGDSRAGTQVSGWLDAWTPAASVYAVKARNTADVVAAVNFAREHRLRLVVKGGGHSYQGTSNAPDSLLVWTRAMNEVTLHEAFVPQGCAGRMRLCRRCRAARARCGSISTAP